MWIMLKNAVEAMVTDLRACLLTMAVPFNLIDTIDTFKWIIQTEPWNLAAKNAAIRTIRDGLNNLSDCARVADDFGCPELRDRISGNVQSVWSILIGYEKE